jgi:glutathione synthase/RimK-type ligase-like ATP-grasp enzyme
VILILSAPSDPHANVVHAKLQERGAAVTWFDPAEIPARARLAVRLRADGRIRRWIERDEGPTLELEQVTAVWHRRPGAPTPCASITDATARAYVIEECREVVLHLMDSLECLSVPAPKPVYRRAENKISQLVHAAAVGLDVPETLLGSSPQAFLELCRELDGRLISKMPSGTLSRQLGQTELLRFTERVAVRDIRWAHTLRHGPVAVQGYVDKEVELRVTVVGPRVFAAEIHSQATRQTKHDWRHYDHLNTPLRPHALPERVAEQCRAVVRRLGLCYGALDLILTPDGRYVFIEVNPNGQYLWIEEETGLPISDAICDLLVSGRAGETLAA